MSRAEHMESQLWDYIDDLTPVEQRPSIEKLVAENLEWRKKYQELLEFKEMVHSMDLEEPSLRFTKNVMEGIAKYSIAPATKNYINHKIIWSIAIFFLTAIIGFLIYGFGQIDWRQGNSNNLLGVDFNKIDYSKMFNNNYLNIFMMFNVILGLMLLDKILSNKRKKFEEAF
ncbi:MAG: hypothetical protein NVS1B13_05730 [Flavisolibacter sp.]